MLNSTEFLEPELYNVDQVCKILNVGRPTAYEIAHIQELGCFKLSNSWRFPKEAIEKFIEMKQNGSL